MVKTPNPKQLLTTHPEKASGVKPRGGHATLRGPRGFTGYSLPTSNAGFTLVEVLVVTVIIATLSVALLFNFGTTARNRTARSQVASVIVSDVRRAQSMALSGTRFNGNVFCGYGVHYVDHVTYLLYAGADEGLPQCQSANHNYQAGIDSVVQTQKIFNQNIEMEFRSGFSDIFFESPDPKTYINNNASLIGGPKTTITIQLINQANCGGQTCTKIEVYTSGQINLID